MADLGPGRRGAPGVALVLAVRPVSAVGLPSVRGITFDEWTSADASLAAGRALRPGPRTGHGPTPAARKRPAGVRARAGALLSALAALVLLSAVSAARAAEALLDVPGGDRLRVTQRGAATVLEIARPGRRARAALPTEEGIFPRSLGRTRLVGAILGRVLILSTDYDSRPDGGARMCGAGTETVLRVIALRPALRETFRQRTASCWTTVEEGEVAWDAGARVLSVERWTFSPEAEHLRTRYRVGANGTVAQQGVERLP